ncbi:Cytochrome b5 [Pleurostoma richardsiae]|uniref:Cytochrome b5 n=1 Tax=Pleurostoma richardsiae TaxID=41990 RepID=A0AA38RWS3_9PEZI|nr:Cytochrome b5 [Pleurostoma richardsiae]
MPESEPTARQRKPASVAEKPTEPRRRPPRDKIEAEDGYNTYVDIFRVLAFLVLASCGLSYLVSNGDWLFWGIRNPPKYVQLDFWKAYFRGPLLLTPAELATFDGTDESKPIYLAINGSIFDVTPGARMYGPGGSYHWLAGVDASRAFVTGCFSTDRTADMRGLEEMFLPLDDPAVDSHWTAAELQEMKAKELEEANNKVHQALKHWVDFFGKSKKYHYVGRLIREPGWLDNEPRRELCSPAAQGRSQRKVPSSD